MSMRTEETSREAACARQCGADAHDNSPTL